MITAIDPSALAGDSLRPGDVIEEVARQPVESPADFERIARALQPGRRVLLSICRGKSRSFVVVPQ